jgi:hypothetical protein
VVRVLTGVNVADKEDRGNTRLKKQYVVAS